MIRWRDPRRGDARCYEQRAQITSTKKLFNALHYYWITAKGYRLRPWASPYIQWRLETFFGQEAAALDARKFFSLMWRERARMKRFLAWVAERRKAQAHLSA